jgi:hypothetical protein
VERRRVLKYGAAVACRRGAGLKNSDRLVAGLDGRVARKASDVTAQANLGDIYKNYTPHVAIAYHGSIAEKSAACAEGIGEKIDRSYSVGL